MRLSDEFQLTYTASHWAQQLNWRGGVFGLLDIVYLLRKARQRLQWDKILNWVGDSVIGSHLYVLLSYLRRAGVMSVNPSILCELFKKQRSFGMLNLRIAHLLVTHCLIEGKAPRGRLGARNLDIVWKTLLLDQRPIYNLMLLTRNFFLPFRLRKAVLP
jgi:hypothetical protein